MRLRPLLEKLHRLLSVSEAAQQADLIFVLAGSLQRKIYALQLFDANFAPRILLSVGRFEIRRFPDLPIPYPQGVPPIDLLAAAQPISPQQRHFFVALDRQSIAFEPTSPGKLGTLREIRALAAWCVAHSAIRSMMIVSSDYHLRRVRMCSRALIPPEIRISYTPPPKDTPPPLRDLLLELLKLPAYALALLWERLRR